jgi:protein-disulfide isomerase
VKRDTVPNGALIVFSACAVTLTWAVVQRTREDARLRQPATLSTVADWKEIAATGLRVGPPNAPVTIVEFGDFQCPYCSQLAAVLAKLRQQYPNQLALVFRHFPIESLHSYALSAAMAAQCAAAQGSFESFHDTTFASQDSIGVRPWTWFASRAGLRDTISLLECMASESIRAVVARDVQAGHDLGITGTPTVLVNQYRLHVAPTFARLDSLVQVALNQTAKHQLSSQEHALRKELVSNGAMH